MSKKLMLLTLLGLLAPLFTVLIAVETGIHPYLMMAITVFSVILLVCSGICGILQGRKQNWRKAKIALFAVLNLLPALCYGSLLFPMWMAGQMYL